MRLERLRQALDRITAPAELSSILTRLCADSGLTHLGVLTIWRGRDTALFGALPETFVQGYLKQSAAQDDPMVSACLGSDTPVDWADSLPRAGTDAPLSLRSLGQNGVAIPLHGPDHRLTILFATADVGPAVWARIMQRHLVSLTLTGHYLHAVSGGPAPPPGHAPLSPRELEVLGGLGMGLSRSKLANLLNISEHTVRAYVENARFKLGCRNTTHAVAVAVAAGLIVTTAASDQAGTAAAPRLALQG